jgi:hypothetical protein
MDVYSTIREWSVVSNSESQPSANCHTSQPKRFDSLNSILLPDYFKSVDIIFFAYLTKFRKPVSTHLRYPKIQARGKPPATIGFVNVWSKSR